MAKDGMKQNPSAPCCNLRNTSKASPPTVESGSAIPCQDKALCSLWAHTRVWTVMLAGLAADLITKSWALGTLGDPDKFNPQNPDTFIRPLVIIHDYVALMTVYNRGAVAGIAQGKTALLVVASFIALGFLFWLFINTRRQQWFCHIAIGLLFGGALGNLYDRLFHDGKVVDFIEIDLHVWPAHPWPTFNIADVLLCVGVGMLILGMGLRLKTKPAEGKLTD